jgi:hypothetical protein
MDWIHRTVGADGKTGMNMGFYNSQGISLPFESF